MIDFQSSASTLRPCPFGTSDNSPAIYGWGRCPQITSSPAGTAEILFGVAVKVCRKFILSILSKPLRLRTSAVQKARFYQTNPFPPIIQSLSKRFKAFQSYSKVLEKKISDPLQRRLNLFKRF
jgi:hypothetical protein